MTGDGASGTTENLETASTGSEAPEIAADSDSPRGPLARRGATLSIKLILVALVPALLAVLAGGYLVVDRFGEVRKDAATVRLADVAARADATAAAVQRERSAVAGTVPSPAQQQELNTQVAGLRAAVAGAAVPSGPWSAASGQLDKLADLRAQATKDRGAAIRGYGAMVAALVDVERAVAGTLRDPSATARATGLADLTALREEVRVQQVLGDVGIDRGALIGTEISGLGASTVRYGAWLTGFNAVAPAADQQRYQGTAAVANRRAALVGRLLAAPSTVPVARTDFDRAADAAATGLGTVATAVAADLADQAATAQDSARTTAIVLTGILVVLLLLAAVLVVVLARRLLAPIHALRRAAQRVAESVLPGAVAAARAGRQVGTVIEPVGEHTGDEIGQLASAFDTVHAEARGLAVEQAGMRGTYGTMFVNLSRRSQTLVQRQLRLIEQLERDEEDPEQLGSLFQLDHLATRMRRNNENLMVLSGAEPQRGGAAAPVPLGDLLRAAVSEIEQYRRVVLEAPPPAAVPGHASGDLVRLLAELLDNATAFSAPDTTVTVSTALDPDGSVLIRIRDHGIGMRRDEVNRANERLASEQADEVPASRQMGLFVVGRLAERQGVHVALQAEDGGVGLTAGVRIPDRLLAALPALDGGLGLDHAAPADRDGEDTVETVLPRPAEPYGSRGVRPVPTPRATTVPPAPPAPPQPAPPQPAPPQPGPVADAAPVAHEPEDEQDDLFSGAGADSAGADNVAADDAAAPTRGVAGGFVAGAALAGAAAAARGLRPDGAAPDAGTDQDPRDGAAAAPDGAVNGHPVNGFAANGSGPTGPTVATGPSKNDGVRGEGGAVDAAVPTTAPGAPTAAERTPIFDSMISVWFADPAMADGTPPAERATQEAAAERAADAAVLGEESERWRFAADAGWQAVEEVSDSEPETFTKAGLPQRTPRARLLPGSAPVGESAPVQPPPDRDADRVRSRMASFQRGVRNGRHSLDITPESAAEQTAQLFGTTVVPPPDAWDSPGDAGQRASEAALDTAPETTTSAGLPLRVPRARLVPGSAPAASAPLVTADRSATLARDPQGVRSRLSSFQRGLSQGRRSVGLPENDDQADSADDAYQWEQE